MTSTRETMALTLEAHKQDLAPHIFERGKKLLSLLNIAAQVLFAMYNEQRRVDICYVVERRHVHVLFEVLPRCGIQVVVSKIPADIAGSEHCGHVGDAAVGDCNFEAVVVANEPVGHEAAITTPGNTYTLLINIATAHDLLKPIHYVYGVLFTPGPAYCQGEFIAETTTAAWVGIEDNIAFGNQ